MPYDPRLQVLDRHLTAENTHDLAGVAAVAIEFREGLMARECFYWDTAGLPGQLGVATLGIVDRAAVPSGGRS